MVNKGTLGKLISTTDWPLEGNVYGHERWDRDS